ncbi:MAG: hypothetical protein HYV35_11405 [Lentisphaerae bacterium]|nr:hypothetical protein [Lentisphaerota bacterium]
MTNSLTRYLPFVEQTVAILLKKQSAPLGGKEDGTLFVTMVPTPSRAWTSVGIWDKDHYELYDIRAVELQENATLVDFDAWPLLKQLALLTGNPDFGRMVEEMKAAFARHGFDAKSGLIFDGQMSKFDVVKMDVTGSVLSDTPHFKPIAGLPWDELWAAAPGQMARFCKATYFGLITRPTSMDFNRYVPYGFDDSERRHVQPFNPRHVGFVYTAAMMIHYWVMDYIHTLNAEALGWAQQMAEKWVQLQHPQTGLLPHFIGAIVPDDPQQSPVPYANTWDAQVAIMFLETADLLGERDATAGLRKHLRDLGLKSLRGIAKHGYDPDRKIFPEWLKLEGGKYTNETFYAFRSPAEKAAALQRDPKVHKVGVFPGVSFYNAAAFSWMTRGSIPCDIAQGAKMTGDAFLTERAADLAVEIMKAARSRTGALNAEGQWCFTATTDYIRCLLALRQTTGNRMYLNWARELADMEIRFLSKSPVSDAAKTKTPDWWRLPGRSRFLNTLLDLDNAGK